MARLMWGGAKARQTSASKISSDFIPSSFLRAARQLVEADKHSGTAGAAFRRLTPAELVRQQVAVALQMLRSRLR